MNTNPENFPAAWLDWLQEKDFDQLDESQQHEVIALSDPETYQDLRETHKLLQQHPIADIRDLKSASSSTKKISLHASWYWQAAAVIFMISTLYFVLRPHKAEIIETVTQIHDTLYLPAKAHDTIALQTESATSNKRLVHKGIAPKKKNTAGVHEIISDLHIVSVHSIDENRNVPKRNSKNEDSLERNFRFVSL
ncbi:MAG: hypothetical protein RIQ62_1220 [Bacteroidota bacterium]|jgi:hypothetical protein